MFRILRLIKKTDQIGRIQFSGIVRVITLCDHSYDPTQLDSTKPFSLVGSFDVIAATIRLNQTVRLSRVVWCDHGCDPTRLNGLVELDRIVWCDPALT